MNEIFDNQISPHVNNFNLTIKLNFIENLPIPHIFHARYLLTENAGLRYDSGFRATPNPVLVDIALIGRNRHQELIDLYSQENIIINETWAWENH